MNPAAPPDQGLTAKVTIELIPLGKSLPVDRGAGLQDLLFTHGVEFPCGGRGLCKGCKVKVLEGSLAETEDDIRKLTSEERSAGWRLACRARADSNLKLHLAQWETAILTDESKFEFTPRDGLGIAIDLGTTTIVAQLIDLQTAHVLGVRTALNEQAQQGADVMSRIEFGMEAGGQDQLQRLVRNQLGRICADLVTTSQAPEEVSRIVIVGNTVMHHLFSGITVEPLSHFPFEPAQAGLQKFSADQLGWNLPGHPTVHFLPCLGGFVGSDILAGIIATRLHENDALVALLDLGTNGEIVFGNRERMLCASTAAGPAFEGARISCGMRAATGAISEVHAIDNALQCHVIGNQQARGICGSGLVDAVACGLELDWIAPTGRLKTGDTLPLTGNVSLNQWDIRELQLAKGAIAAGVTILLQQWKARREDLSRVYLAGAFGNYIDFESARKIGLLNFSPEQVVPAGNTALLGAKLALFDAEQHDGSYPDLLRRIQHVSLHEDELFQQTYVEEMVFPAS